jgi:hypothetical protein
MTKFLRLEALPNLGLASIALLRKSSRGQVPWGFPASRKSAEVRCEGDIGLCIAFLLVAMKTQPLRPATDLP